MHRLLHGIKAPQSEGVIVEVHVDVVNPSDSFTDRLIRFGFENDPFDQFHPEGYAAHMTGRTRVEPKNLASTLHWINGLVDEVLLIAKSSDIDLYTEVELIRNEVRFETVELNRHDGTGLCRFNCPLSGEFGSARADLHIEFLRGQVPDKVHRNLRLKNFYWVSTPSTVYFPAEDIATLQTSTYRGALRVYDFLVRMPLQGCTGMHLEQKLSMKSTRPDLKMPAVVHVFNEKGELL